MALVMMCGLPSAGKTRRAVQLRDYFEQRGRSVVLINEEALGLDRRACYKDLPAEKNTRGAIKGAVDRALSRDTVVICDYMNFVKGFRYELFCIARSVGVPHCVLFCDTPVEQAREFNAARGDSGYDEKTLEDLLGRLEVPNSRNRWDSPLLRLTASQDIDGEAVERALAQKGEVKPTLATSTGTEFVFQLDQVTQEIIAAILAGQSQLAPGQPLTVSRSTEKLQLPRQVSIAELRQHQRSFVKAIQLGHGPQLKDVESAGTAFVKYLNRAVMEE